MTLLSLEHIVGCEGYYIDDKDLKIYSFKQDYKNGKLLKPFINKNGYIGDSTKTEIEFAKSLGKKINYLE